MSAKWWILIAVLILLLLVAAIAGQKKKTERDLTGKWQGKVNFKQDAVDRKLAELEGKPVQKAFTLKFIEALKSATLDFHLRADGTYTMTSNVGPFSKTDQGKWKVLQANPDKSVVELVNQKGQVNQVGLEFTTDDEFLVALPGEQADIAIFRCQKQ